MKDYIAELKERMQRWSPLGEKSYGDGTLRIGHLKERGIGAFLHTLYGPLSEEEIETLEQIAMQTIPETLRHFYRHHNGCYIFRGSIFVFGLRRSYDRSDFNAMACNPFDLRIPAVTNRSKSPTGQGLCICEYQDHSPVFIEPDGAVVHTPNDESGTVLNRWDSFEHWITSEFDRLALFFDMAGNASVPLKDTIPLPRARLS